ncbi:hypothetical protein [Deinococcus pimensis]|uniref:hypothetical protein n=1 Tax=Deinococcus pimensis TaxID=309888 RepID=UPI0004851171|nr:hypothetical protein [Deinococcus pimensis]
MTNYSELKETSRAAMNRFDSLSTPLKVLVAVLGLVVLVKVVLPLLFGAVAATLGLAFALLPLAVVAFVIWKLLKATRG